MKHVAFVVGMTAILAGCAPTGGTTGTSRNVPEEVLAMAGPGQDLSTAELLEDGCFWYRHVGPVETTMLPLRAADGRPICAAVEETA